MAEIRLLYIPDVNAVIGYLALLYVIEAVYKVGYGGLARAGSADEGYLLPRLCKEAHIVEDYLIRDVAKVHVLQSHVALYLGKLARGLLPRPRSGVLGYFRQRAVYVSGVDQSHLSLVFLAPFVHHCEYALRARQGHDYGVELL